LFFFYCILAYYKPRDKFSATEHTLHIVKIYQKGILYYLYQNRSPNKSNGKISYRFFESNTANHWMTVKQKFVAVQEDWQQQQQMQK
jgi:hypothetical protein